MHAAVVDALHAAEAALVPGRPIGEVFDAHARVVDAAGFQHARGGLNACGYSLGTTFAPNWMDWPMFYTGQSYGGAAGQRVLHPHHPVRRARGARHVAPRATSHVGERGAEPLSVASLDSRAAVRARRRVLSRPSSPALSVCMPRSEQLPA